MALSSTLAGDGSKSLSDDRIAGPMPWVIAIMVFLTILAASAGISLASTASQNSDILARKMTVQILEADPVARDQQRSQLTEYLTNFPQTRSVTPLSDQQVAQLLEPWLGMDEGLTENNDLIPLPAIIDVEMNSAVNDKISEQLVTQMRGIAPTVRVDTQESWIAPLYDLMRSLIYLIFALILLLAVATSATVVLAVRSALDTHRNTLDIMHLMGSTDSQISRLFQRRVATDAFFGGAIGFVMGCLTIIFISMQVNNLVSGAITDISMPWYGWIILLAIPVLMGVLSIYMARWTVKRAMKKKL